MSKKSIPLKEIKVLWGLSYNNCAICKKPLIEEGKTGDYPVGVQAHIEGENPNSARYNPDMSDEERYKTDNLILLFSLSILY